LERTLEVFREEISAHQGTVTEAFNQGGRLFVRSVLPRMEEIRARDMVQSGVALRATDAAAWVYPYVFRQVCKNGAIMAQAAQGREIPELGTLPVFEAEPLLREAIESCRQKEAFATAVGQMRSATQHQVETMLSLMPFLSRLSAFNSALAQQVLDRFFKDDDQTRYGLMNAVTSVARDTRSPEVRWRLEEFGGEMAGRAEPEPAMEEAAEEVVPQSDRLVATS
jgi:hypothetical protein